MLEKLIRALAADAQLSPEQIMDVLWLSATRPLGEADAASPADGDGSLGSAGSTDGAGQRAPEETAGGTDPTAGGSREDQVPLRLDGGTVGGERIPAAEVRFGAPPPIHDPLRLAQALRGLKAIRAPGPRPEVDIDATVEATADARRLTIVMNRPLGRVLDLAIVVDGAPAMRIWDDTFDQFELVLAQTGAFRTVSRWRLVTGTAGEAQLADRSDVRQPARRLVDPAGRRIVLIVTDAVAPNWYSGSLWAAVAAWGSSMPTAIVQVLPPHYWPSTAIGEPYLTARAKAPASPNARYARRLDWWATDPGGDPVPVLALTAEAFAAWTRAAVTGTGWVNAITAIQPDPEHAPVAAAADDPVTVVNDFLMLASDGAERLARVLSGAATLSMPLISVLQKKFAAGAVTELAEILASGLLVEVAGTRAVPASAGRDERQPLLRFREGVREILQRGTTAFDEWAIYNAVSSFLADHGHTGGTLRALVPDPGGPAELNLVTSPFAALEESLAVRLGIRPAPVEPTPPAPQAAPLPESAGPVPEDAESSTAVASGEPEPPSETVSPSPPISSADAVLGVAVSPDGTWLVSGGADGIVRIWDPATGQRRWERPGHVGAVRAVAVSPDGTWLVSGGADGIVRFWDSATGESRGVLRGHSNAVNVVGVSPDGSWVVSGGAHGTLRFWDTVTLRQRNMTGPHTGAVTGVAVSPDGTWLVSGGVDGRLNFLDSATLRLRAEWRQTDAVRAVAVSSDGTQVVSGGASGTVAVHDPPTLRLRSKRGTGGAVNAVAVSPDGAWLVSGGADGRLMLLDSAALGLRVEWRNAAGVNAVAVSPDGSWVVSGGADGALRVWDVTTGRQLGVMVPPAGDTPASAAEARSVADSGDPSHSEERAADWLDFEVAIVKGRAPRKYLVRVIRSPAGEASAEVDLDVERLLADRDSFQQALLISSVRVRAVEPRNDRYIREVGTVLFKAALGAGTVADRYRASLGLAEQRGAGLRIVLLLDTPALATLPWEAMFDNATHRYLCRHGHQIVRSLPTTETGPLPMLRPPLRILEISSSPRGLPALDVEHERAQLARALDTQVQNGSVELSWVPSANLADLRSMLQDGRPHVLHFLGHGGFDPEENEGWLAMEDADGEAMLVAAGQFADVLHAAQPVPRLVVLTSCDSGARGSGDAFSGTAAALTRSGVTAVAAMQYLISDTAAAAFTRGLYTALAQGRKIDEAVAAGRAAILGTSAQTMEWITPVLYLRGNESRLFVEEPF